MDRQDQEGRQGGRRDSEHIRSLHIDPNLEDLPLEVLTRLRALSINFEGVNDTRACLRLAFVIRQN